MYGHMLYNTCIALLHIMYVCVCVCECISLHYTTVQGVCVYACIHACAPSIWVPYICYKNQRYSIAVHSTAHTYECAFCHVWPGVQSVLLRLLYEFCVVKWKHGRDYTRKQERLLELGRTKSSDLFAIRGKGYIEDSFTNLLFVESATNVV